MTHITRMPRIARRVVVAWAAVLSVVSACADDGRNPGALASSSGSGAGQPCSADQTRACGVLVAEHEGVVFCAEGSQACVDGGWSECETVDMVAKVDNGFDLQALSTPATCNNPCDPSCMAYDEVPMPAFTGTPSGLLYDWASAAAPAGTSSPPCQNAADCQGDSYCANPATTCEHSVCSTGGPLVSGCDPCATAVCAANSSCCQQGTACATAFGGVATFIDCSAANDSSYCQFNHEGADCDTVCAGGGGTCLGAWNDHDNNECSINPTQPFACNYDHTYNSICRCTRPGAGTWDAACTSLVTDLCGAFCQTPGDTSGTCVPWAPGEVDASCSGIELTAAPGCTDTLVVCNRGTVDAPAGIEVVHYPQADGAYAVCDPTPLPLSATTCLTGEIIPAGECINVTGCPNLTTGPRAVVVNPPGTAHVAECHTASCLNNWTLWEPVACGAASCNVSYTSPSGCTLQVPFQHTSTDPTTVSYDNGVAAPVTITEVSGAAACTSGLQWYWEDPSTQAAIVLCPATCTMVTGMADQCTGASEYYDAAGGRCYLHQTTAEWAAHRAACQTWGGDLAVIGSQAEQDYLAASVLPSTTTSQKFLAGTDAATENVWLWATGEPWIYANWLLNEPAGGANPRDCLVIENTGYWRDIDCGSSTHGLCERGKLAKQLVISKPCPPLYGEFIHTETYEPNCGSGKTIQWGFLGWDTLTPGTSAVEFSFRTAVDVASLSSASWIVAGTATALAGNEICSITAPSGACPIDLFELLDGLPQARYPVGEIQIRVVPEAGGSPTPTVNDWTLTYSCVDSE